MTKREARDLLDSIEKLEENFVRSKLEVARCKSILEPSGNDLTRPKVQSDSNYEQHVAEAIDRMIKAQTKANRDYFNWNNALETANKVLDNMEDASLSKLLYQRYLAQDRFMWDEIASDLGYSRHSMYDLHQRALRQFAGTYELIFEMS